MRQAGNSISSIEKKLSIPRSTLSGWFRTVKLTAEQRAVLREKRNKDLVAARKQAVLWHREQKSDSFRRAEASAKKLLSSFSFSDKKTLEIALAMLYLGEGFKKDSGGFGMGSSDPHILKFFLESIIQLYGIQRDDIRCELYLRADQSPEVEKTFWMQYLGLRSESFRYTHKDKRTMGTKTFPTYHGVCSIRGGSLDTQRRIIAIGRVLCEKAENITGN